MSDTVIEADASEDACQYSMLLQWDPLDRIYVVTIPELPGCQTHGRTHEEAVAQGKDAIASWLSAHRASGRPVPSPRIYTETLSAGAFQV